MRGRAVSTFLAAVLIALLGATPTLAETIANPVASFSGLDKITGRITKFDVYVNETVLFGYADDTASLPDDRTVLAGALVITPRVCYTRPPTETQRTSVFVEVDRVDTDGQAKRIFTGWMFADSPALNAIDDPVYDIWLTDCKQSTNVPQLKTSIDPPATTTPVPGQQATPTPQTTAGIDDRG